MSAKVENTFRPQRYSESQFCEIVGIGLRTARRLRQSGELTYGRTGRKIWYTDDHVRRYYEEHTVSARVAA